MGGAMLAATCVEFRSKERHKVGNARASRRGVAAGMKVDDLLARATHATSRCQPRMRSADAPTVIGERSAGVGRRARPANREQNLADVHPQKPLDPLRLQLAALIPRR
jgi:hypothetical protein